MFYFMNFVHSFVNYVIFRELCDRMRFEIDCAKSHHRIISEGLIMRFFVNCAIGCDLRSIVRNIRRPV